MSNFLLRISAENTCISISHLMIFLLGNFSDDFSKFLYISLLFQQLFIKILFLGHFWGINGTLLPFKIISEVSKIIMLVNSKWVSTFLVWRKGLFLKALTIIARVNRLLTPAVFYCS